ncbi:MAG TPA: hypothetical protein VK996_10090 [Ramlibacter sp.]|nr:hypothetical protein [Ramlibacter sp.]
MHQSPEKKPPRRRDKYESDLAQDQLARRTSRDSGPRARKSALERDMEDVRWDTEPPDKRS